MVDAINVNMTRGEVTPLMAARVDNELYESGMSLVENLVVMRHGGLTRAPGTIYLGALEAAGANATYLLPFIFNTEQVYTMEFGDEIVRFWTRDGQVMDGGSPYEVASPYAIADVPNIKLWQSGDVVYLACDGYQPRTLTRSGETDWAFALYEPEDGPFMEQNLTSTTLTPDGYGCVTPTMTSNTAPSPAVVSGGGGATAYYAFDKTRANFTISSSTDNNVQIDLGPGNAATVVNYVLNAVSNSNGVPNTPITWVLQGSNNGSTWVTLDSVEGETNWTPGERRYFTLVNSTAYRYYKFAWEAVDGGADSRFRELWLGQDADEMPSITITASSVTGINNDQGFQASDVGRPISLYGADGKRRWLEIVSVTDTTHVEVKLHGYALPSLDGTTRWALGAWSEETGWPRAVGSYEDRIVWGGSASDPFTVWGTRNADYDSFRVSDPVVDDDAVKLRPGGSSRGLNPVQWLMGGSNLLVGTSGGLQAFGPRDSGKAFAPGNVRQLDDTPIQLGPLPALDETGLLLFLDRYGKRLFEAAYSAEADSYVTRELSVLHEHLLLAGVARYAFQSTPHRILWCVMTDGTVRAATYDRDQKVFGITRRLFDGVVDDVLVLPGDGEDDVFFSTRRTINGSTASYMELMAPFYRAGEHDYFCYLDCAIVGEVVMGPGYAGLTHLVGEYVRVVADGYDLDDTYLVDAGGSTGVQPAGTVAYAVRGLPMPWKTRSLRAAQWGSNSGKSIGRSVRVVEGLLHLFESAGVSAGVVDNVNAVVPDMYKEGDLLTGTYQMIPPDDTWSNGGVVEISGETGYPATILGYTLQLEGS